MRAGGENMGRILRRRIQVHDRSVVLKIINRQPGGKIRNGQVDGDQLAIGERPLPAPQPHGESAGWHAEAGGGTVKGAGSVYLGKPIGAEGKLQFSRFDPSRFGDYPEGSISGTAEISGNPGTPRRLVAQWTLSDSVLAGHPLASRGRAPHLGVRLQEVDVTAPWGANCLSATGAFGPRGDALAWRLRAPRPPIDVVYFCSSYNKDS